MHLPVLKQHDVMVGIDIHEAIVPPSPTPIKLPHAVCAQIDWVKDGKDLHHSVLIQGKAAVSQLHDIGHWIPHVCPNLLLPFIIGFSSSHVLLASSTVLVEGKPMAAGPFVTPVLNCGEPVPLPFGFILNTSTVRINITWSDLLRAIAYGLVIMAISFIAWAIGNGLGKLLGKGIKSLTTKISQTVSKEISQSISKASMESLTVSAAKDLTTSLTQKLEVEVTQEATESILVSLSKDSSFLVDSTLAQGILENTSKEIISSTESKIITVGGIEIASEQVEAAARESITTTAVTTYTASASEAAQTLISAPITTPASDAAGGYLQGVTFGD